MAFTSRYAIVLKVDTGLAAEKRVVCDVFRTPNQVPASGTAGTDTSGPLSTGGTATANIVHGDGTTTGFAGAKDALQRAIVLLLDDLALNDMP